MRLRKLVTMREALDDPRVLRQRCSRATVGAAWRVLLDCDRGEELTDERARGVQGPTGREREPLEMVEEFWAIIGQSRRQNPRGGHPGGVSGAPVSTIATSWRRASAACCRSWPRQHGAGGARHSITLRASSQRLAASLGPCRECRRRIPSRCTTGVDITVRPAELPNDPRRCVRSARSATRLPFGEPTVTSRQIRT